MKKVIVLLCFAEIVVLYLIFSPQSYNLQYVSCDVGQGDAHLILYHNVQILVDAGERKEVLSCLGKYMPISDHHLEVAIMTHPEFDHAGGFNAVLDRYNVGLIIANSIDNSTESYRLLKKKVGDLHIPVIQPLANDKLKIDDLVLTFVHPGPDIVDTPGFIVLGQSDSQLNLNDYSITFLSEHDGTRALFTGDISPEQISNMLFRDRIGKVNLLKVPHHGSKNGLTNQLLEDVSPDIAVISVGRKNKFGHPDREILDLLLKDETQVYRTDLMGDVAFVEENGKLVLKR